MLKKEKEKKRGSIFYFCLSTINKARQNKQTKKKSKTRLDRLPVRVALLVSQDQRIPVMPLLCHIAPAGKCQLNRTGYLSHSHRDSIPVKSRGSDSKRHPTSEYDLNARPEKGEKDGNKYILSCFHAGRQSDAHTLIKISHIWLSWLPTWPLKRES